jgi:hypothetical protein
MAVLRSILAVLAAIVFVVAASVGTDLALAHSLIPAMNTSHAPAWALAVALAYRTLYGVIGGWIAARLAPGRPMTHALVLGAIGTLVALAGVVAAWSFGQHWYPIALVILSLPQSWLGARLAASKV